MTELPRKENDGGTFHGDTLDLFSVVRILWTSRYKITLGTCLVAIVSLFVAMQIPNRYVSNALLAPRESSEGAGGLGQVANQLGGLASFTGVNIAGGRQVRDSTIAIQTVRSLAFFNTYIYDKMLVELVAIVGWDGGRQFRYDSASFDQEKFNWIDDKPSVQSAYGYYQEAVVIEEDPKTNLITLAVTHYSPKIAKELADLVISSINEKMRASDVAEAQKAILYLSEQRLNTDIVSLDEIFGRLIEDQTKTIMLANVSEDYVFDVIDPPVVPESKATPSRGVIVIISSLLGGSVLIIASLILSLVRSGELDRLLSQRNIQVLD